MRLVSVVLAASLLTGAAPSAFAGSATAILAGGCFWCLEHDMAKVQGVTDAVSGYAGGTRQNPTYKDYNRVDAANPVPHEEVVRVTYDPERISYAKLLDVYFRSVDPTDGDGQFCDRGAGYRPAIYAGSAEEQKAAEAGKAKVAQLLKTTINVSVLPAAPFYPAEDYHQDYAEKNPVKYRYYRWNCGRDQRIDEVWSAAPASAM